MRNLIRRVTNALTGNRRGKVILSIPKNPANFSDEDWYQEFKRKNEEEYGDGPTEAALCPWPECNGHMLSGPEGGLGVNIKCDICQRRWNLMAVIQRMERL